MKIQLIDYNRGMFEAWKTVFNDLLGIMDIDVVLNSAFALPTECIVSPANSFGFMDGGFDATISNYLGMTTMANVQKKIREEYNGELLVGQAFYVETGHKAIPYCICAPTMRVPAYLGKTSVNAYLAAKAIFRIIKDVNVPFKSVTIPGLGTGVGAIPYNICAHQMRTAYDEVIADTRKDPVSWREAQVNHIKLFELHTTEYADIQHKKNVVDTPSNQFSVDAPPSFLKDL